ncbi:hypothetical protein [Nocardia aurantia]|uniref:Uncharacterized protein n=1 Tax=Nocardia aurantia TaxID=2585199 RepID=A0A7K0DQ57_9NOCA|nr:hypothetical protein [Nocardia aurantia]MQY27841.1 hypothetical protein [Nocardia aurantia]
MNTETRTAASLPAIVNAPSEDDVVVTWPDPSPLQDWWAEVMSGKAAGADAA